MERKIRNAAKALIISDNKMLAIKISDGKEEWYIMPGGGQESEELLPDAICREVAEELGINVAVKDLVFVIEGLHGENFHRVDLVFLCEFESDTYDITLLLGPMYHLYTIEDKLKALSEAIRVTKKGGIVFIAYCMGDASVLSYGFIRGEIYNIIEKCMIDTETFDTFSNPWDIFELHRKEDIDKLRAEFDVTQLHFVATDGYANHMRSTLAEMDDRMYELYIKYHLATCERQDMIGYSHHTLDIFRKD